MNIDIYKLQQATTFIAVPAGQPLPPGDFTVGASFTKRVELCPHRPRIAMDNHQVLADIAEQGWSVWQACFTLEVR